MCWRHARPGLRHASQMSGVSTPESMYELKLDVRAELVLDGTDSASSSAASTLTRSALTPSASGPSGTTLIRHGRGSANPVAMNKPIAPPWPAKRLGLLRHEDATQMPRPSATIFALGRTGPGRGRAGRPACLPGTVGRRSGRSPYGRGPRVPGVVPGRKERQGMKMNRIRTIAAAAAMLALTVGTSVTSVPSALAATAAPASRAAALGTTTPLVAAGPAHTARLLRMTSRVISHSGSTVYTFNDIVSCNDSCSVTADLNFHATISSTQVWINGKVNCSSQGSKVTWCGNTNNGTSYLDTGMNFDGYWLRADIYPRDHTSYACNYRGNVPYFHWVDCESS